MSLLETFKTEQQPLAVVLPGQGPLHTQAQRMEHRIAPALPSALGGLAIAPMLFEVRQQPRMENARPIACGINAALEVERGSTAISTDLVGPRCQRLQALRPQGHGGCIDRSHGDRR